MGDAILDAMNGYAGGQRTQYVYVRDPDADAERDRAIKERDAAIRKKAEFEKLTTDQKVNVAREEGRLSVIPYAQAGNAAAMGHELNYRAWRAVAEALGRAAAGGETTMQRAIKKSRSGWPVVLTGESMSMAVVEHVATQEQARGALTPVNLRRLARVERWRLMASALMNNYQQHPDDVEEGAQSYFVNESIKSDGSSARPVTDLVADFERRKPGMMAGIARAGHQALRELKQIGLLPEDAEDRLKLAAKSLREEGEKSLVDLNQVLASLAETRKAHEVQVAECTVQVNAQANLVDLVIGDRPKKTLFGGDAEQKKWDALYASKFKAAEELPALKRVQAEMLQMRADIDKKVRDVTEEIAKIERDFRLNVPEINAIAIAGDAMNLPGMGG